MLGTIVNVIAVLVGSTVGMLAKRGLAAHLQESLQKVMGVGVLIVALNGVIANMFRVTEDGKLGDSGGLLLIISLVVGTLVGELLRLEDRINGIGLAIERKLRVDGFARGFIDASLLFCIGAMTIVGSLNDGLRGDSSILFIKSTLDFVMSIILASSLGIGVLFSSVTVLVIQGSISLSAGLIAPLVSDAMLASLCMVGYAIVLCMGFNFVGNSKIRTANLLPALLVPVVYHLGLSIVNRIG